MCVMRRNSNTKEGEKIMKTIVSKVALLGVVAALTLPLYAGDITVKPNRYTSPPKSLFPAKKVEEVTLAACCKENYAWTTTQDSKLKTKPILIATHGCPGCNTTRKTIGGQKAGLKEVIQHSCAGKVTTAAICCDNMPEMK